MFLAPSRSDLSESLPTINLLGVYLGELAGKTLTGREIHGPNWDPRTQPLDGEVIMRVGGGKKHGRYYIGDGLLDTASTPTLAQVRARSTSSSPAIRPRVPMTLLQVQEFVCMFVLRCNIAMKYCR